MSPVSRGRKGRAKKRSSGPRTLAVVGPSEECGCPACSAEGIDPEQMIDELLAGGTEMLASDDPLDAELTAAALVATGDAAGEGFEEVLADGMVPDFEERAAPGGLAMLLALGMVAPGRAARAASAAAQRLVKAGVPAPRWAAELDEPVTVDDCRSLGDPQGVAAMLVATFRRVGREHSLLVQVNYLDCGAARDIMLIPTDQMPEALEQIRTRVGRSGLGIEEQILNPAEFRWQVEQAIDARAVHDAELSQEESLNLLLDEEGPSYPTLLPLLRARLATLPVSSKPKPPHGHDSPDLSPLGLTTFISQFTGQQGGRGSGRGRSAAPKLPAKRKKSDRPAPIYQLKVGLRGAKPPIWRRLEVPADISLTRLHWIIQTAFAWENSHLHVFETPYGNFGRPDAELGYRSADRVTLEQVALETGSRFSYLYDFGDNWKHEILVEKVSDREASVKYPRCTGGRRAAPPEDCGGVWGYADLMEILSNPADPEHAERLDWLGLDDAAQFDPARFDVKAVTEALATLR